MKQKKVLIAGISLVATALLGAAASAAEDAGAAEAGATAGLLGKRWVAAEFAYVDYDDTGSDLRGVDLVLNVPLTTQVDLGLTVGYGDLEDLDVLSGMGGATWHWSVENFKPFVGAGIGYVDVEDVDGRWVWQIGGGVEIPLGERFSAAPFIRYSDDFEGGEGGWDFGVQGEAVIASDWSLTATVSVSDESDWSLGAGAVFRF